MVKKTTEALDPIELEAESKKAQETFKKSQEENIPETKMYNENEVRQMLEQVMKSKSNDDLSDDETPEKKRCTIPRFQNKFVIAFKDMNDDPYSDKAIYAFNVYDEKNKQNIPWVTLIMDDKSEISVPLNTALDRSNKITCEVLDIKEVDASYDFGKVEKQEVQTDAYSKTGTGVYVKTKVTQKIYSYVVKLPEPDGREVEVSRDVMNWSVATV